MKRSAILPPPARLKAALPASERARSAAAMGRRAIRRILDGKDDRLLLIVGPCSIHDVSAALEYARRLRALARVVEKQFLIIMRVYLEKPRTALAWKGLINDPFLDGSCRMKEGLERARRLLIDIAGLGLPTAMELLDPFVLQYLSDLVSWHAVGARCVESPLHRELASGLETPVGFKNGLDGSLDGALNAQRFARERQSFIGLDEDGRLAARTTAGNPYGHLVLRGGRRPNFDARSVRDAARRLREAGLREALMIDCSHGNSGKDHRRQSVAFKSALRQAGRRGAAVIGMMLESNLAEGRQSLRRGGAALRYGVSVTDPCLGWEETEKLIRDAARAWPSGGSR